ncbi:hypothetical protein KC887_02430 [Candidatus Kaiserbacteria bacterium]|nr:hypothetical protein [Candidatus Kaiserbacteria bacterium]
MLRQYKGKNQNPDGLSFTGRSSIHQEQVGRSPQKPSKINPEKEWQRVKQMWDSVEAWERYSGFRLPDDHPDKQQKETPQ